MSAKRPADGGLEDAQPKKRSFAAGTDIVIVLVGEGEAQVKYAVHKNVLCKCSFFDKCLNSGMKEEHEKMVKLPEDSPDAMDIIIDWLYHEKLSDIPANAANEKAKDRVLLNAYVTANKYCLPDLQNALMDQIRASWVDCSMDPGYVLLVLNETPEGCFLREYALNQLQFDLTKNTGNYYDEEDKSNPYSLTLQTLINQHGTFVLVLLQKMTELYKAKSLKEHSKVTGCVYHLHENDKKCIADEDGEGLSQ